ncbi:MAG: hypothetical protein FWB96_04440 [Defluviitaleaceae bacterium]|nr:hypothetical protein [Defluviitaleaceae bacterium]MCL2262944.1 hypothetical protein [Defluviitaleaceae bacterium]
MGLPIFNITNIPFDFSLQRKQILVEQRIKGGGIFYIQPSVFMNQYPLEQGLVKAPITNHIHHRLLTNHHALWSCHRPAITGNMTKAIVMCAIAIRHRNCHAELRTNRRVR